MTNKRLEQAVKQFKNGHEEAFDVIYHETKTKVYYTILHVVKDHALAEDLMQETYLKMIEALPKYERQNQFPAWLATIAKNLAINTYNKRKKETLVDVSENPYIFGESIENNEKSYYLNSLLNRLSKEEKEIVLRHVLLDQKHKEIAEALNKPLGTVTWLYSEALKKLKEMDGE
ncbi:MAG: RNA polymerase sigma factor [Candidatus Izemoplasmataceae bacterium]